MNCRCFVLLLSLFYSMVAFAATSRCQLELVPAGTKKLGMWLDKGNWLAVENHRVTLQAVQTFMPAWRLAVPAGGKRAVSNKQRSLENSPVVDPFDGSRRNLGFLLDSRLYADGLVVLRNGRVVAERYRNGLLPDKPRLLLDASRPLLNLLGAMSVHQGKLSPDKSVVRYLPGLAMSHGLRKVSIQRLLEDKEHFVWEQNDLDAWRLNGGWMADQAGGSMRAWMSEPGRWDKPMEETQEPSKVASAPDDDLLAWLLAESHAMPLAQLFCEQLLQPANPEHPMLWASDPQGVELAQGIGLSLRDFAKLGHLLVEARSSRSRARIPAWFVETLVASSGFRSTEIKGLSKGSERRYGFVHLGGAPNRVALIGAHGTSLYMDFDKRLVIAFYATRPGGNTPETLALLEQIWKAVDRAARSP